jgi:hypothetical protein
MKKRIIYSFIGVLIGCGPDRSFEDKNIFGSQTSGTFSDVSISASSGGDAPTWSQDDIGYNVGQSLPVWLSWEGYPEGIPDVAKLTKLRIDQLYDPVGVNGINAVLFLTSKYDCSACAKESKQLQSKIEEWNSAGKGIRVVVLVINSPTNSSPDLSSALQWKSQYGLIDAAVGIDPTIVFAVKSTFATPLRTIVDPRTMKVAEVAEGYSDDYSTLEALANENK